MVIDAQICVAYVSDNDSDIADIAAEATDSVADDYTCAVDGVADHALWGC